MSYNEAIIPSYFLFITSIFFTLRLSNKFNKYIFLFENNSILCEKNINILSDKIDEDKKLFIEKNYNSSNENESLIKENNCNECESSSLCSMENKDKSQNVLKLSIQKNEEKNKFIIHNMDLFFNELYIASFIFDSFADENKKLFDNIKPIIYYNNYLDIYDAKHCFVLDNYLNNKFGWIIISDECQILKNEEVYINFSYENMNEFIIWKKNFEESKKYYSNIIKINFFSEKISMNLHNNLSNNKHNFKSYYIIYKNNI